MLCFAVELHPGQRPSDVQTKPRSDGELRFINRYQWSQIAMKLHKVGYNLYNYDVPNQNLNIYIYIHTCTIYGYECTIYGFICTISWLYYLYHRISLCLWTSIPASLEARSTAAQTSPNLPWADHGAQGSQEAWNYVDIYNKKKTQNYITLDLIHIYIYILLDIYRDSL